MRITYKVLVGKPEGKLRSGMTRNRCEDNVKTDLKEMGCVGMNWRQLSRLRCSGLYY